MMLDTKHRTFGPWALLLLAVACGDDDNPPAPSSEAKPVIELAVELVAEADFNLYARARADYVAALGAQSGVGARRLFRSFFSSSAADVPAARVGVTSFTVFSSEAAYDAARAAVSEAEAAVGAVSTEEARLLVRFEDGTTDLGRLDGAALEIAVREVEASTRAAYDTAQQAFLGPLNQISGVVTQEFELVRAPAQVTAGFSTYATQAALGETLNYYTTDTLAFTFFGSFKLLSSQFGSATAGLPPVTLPEALSLNETAAPEDVVVFEHTLYVSDISGGSVLALDLLNLEAGPRTFVEAATGSTRPQTWGLRVDRSRRRLLVTANTAYAFDGNVPVSCELRAYSLDSGERVGSWATPENTVCNPVVVDDAGRYFIGDIGPDARILRVDPESEGAATVWADPTAFSDGGFGLGGMVFGAGAIYGIQAPGLFYRVPILVDGTAGPLEAVRAVDASGEAFTSFFADGMAWFDGDIYYALNDAQQAGANGVVFKVDFDAPTSAVITPLQTGLKDPSGVTVGEVLGQPTLFVNESQLGHAFGVDSGMPTVPYRVLRFEL